MPLLSIILVNYNDRIHLAVCLASLEAAAAGLETEVIVVDNNSQDGSAELVLSSFPSVRLIRNEENVGYARANNFGFRQSRGDFILFLNTDTVVPPAALRELLAELESRPEAGAIGPALRDERGRYQVSFGKGVSFLLELRQKLLLNSLSRFALRFSSRTREVGWLSGACLLLRRRAFEAAGLFDEHFFLYFEDIDLCRRIKDEGYRLVFSPAVKVTHVGGAATAARKGQSRLEYRRSQLYYYRKHNPRGSNLLLKIYLIVSLLFSGIAGSGRGEERALYRRALRELLRRGQN
jgi:GT2 family glycosyltransferase